MENSVIAPTGALYVNSSDRSCLFYDVLLNIQRQPLFEILTQSIDSFYDYFNDIFGTSWGHNPDDHDDSDDPDDPDDPDDQTGTMTITIPVPEERARGGGWGRKVYNTDE